MKKEFALCQGVSLRNTGNVQSCFADKEDGCVCGILSAEMIKPLAENFIGTIKEPVFFFLELSREDSDEYDTYFLDNCTKDVAAAIMQRYGDLLVNDGTSRFGFGSNSTDEELYFEDYQEFMLYMKNTVGAKNMLREIGAVEKENYETLWGQLSDDNVGCLSAVEVDGETVYDIPQNLNSVGMYKSE